jgi:hypothetical protein
MVVTGQLHFQVSLPPRKEQTAPLAQTMNGPRARLHALQKRKSPGHGLVTTLSYLSSYLMSNHKPNHTSCDNQVFLHFAEKLPLMKGSHVSNKISLLYNVTSITLT